MKPGRPRSDEPTETIAIRLPRSVIEQVDASAQNAERTRSGYLARLIRQSSQGGNRSSLPPLPILSPSHETTSPPNGFLVPIHYSEIFGTMPTRQELHEIVRKMDWLYVVSTVAGITAVSWRDGVEDTEHQSALVAACTQSLLYYYALWRRLTEGRRALFTRESLLALLRIAIVEKSSGSAPESQYTDYFAKANLMANELLGLEITPKTFTHSASDLLASEIRSAPLNRENPHDLLGRTDAFFAWSRSNKAITSRNYLPVEDDLKCFTGLTPIEYAAGAYGVLARYASMQKWEDVERMGVFFKFDDWQKGVADTRIPKQWLKIHSIPIAVARKEWEKEESLSFVGAGVLWKKPVVQADDGRYFIPSTPLVTNMMGDGTYFTLFDGYGNDADDAKKMCFSRFWSEFFEDYIAECFQDGYRGRSDANVFREFEYVNKEKETVKSSDLIITESNDILFVEIVAKRMNFHGSVLRLDEKTIAKDLKKGVLEKTDQLHRNIRDYRNGILLPSLPRPKRQRIFPVLVAPSDWPRVNLISSILKEAAQEKWLVSDAEPLELLDTHEVERLEVGLRAGISFGALLFRKNQTTPHNRMMSLRNYLILVEPETLPEGNTRARERGGEVGKKIMEVIKSAVAATPPADVAHTADP